MAQKKNQQSKEESYKVQGKQVLEKIKELIKAGNVRRIIIKDKNGKELIAFPLTFGVIGTALAPVLAAVGAIAALITECTISVERSEK